MSCCWTRDAEGRGMRKKKKLNENVNLKDASASANTRPMLWHTIKVEGMYICGENHTILGRRVVHLAKPPMKEASRLYFYMFSGFDTPPQCANPRNYNRCVLKIGVHENESEAAIESDVRLITMAKGEVARSSMFGCLPLDSMLRYFIIPIS